MSEIDDGYIYHIEKIVCPHCGLIQDAKVEHSVPYFTYIHTCEECGYTIMESEWELYKSKAEKLAEEYADKQLAIVDKELSESGYSRHTKMGIHLFEGSDIEEAYLQGYEQAERDVIKKAMEWIEYNGKNGGCIYDRWKDDFPKEMKE